jgi:apolipoprotein N-acyltransferase
MATDVMQPEAPGRSRIAEPTVRQLIADARELPVRGKGAWLLSASTSILLWGSFTPLDWGPLGWIALVPLILLVRVVQPPRRLYLAVYASGLAFSLVSLQWMRLGDPTMYLAWWALAFYVAMYFPLFVLLSRVAVHRFAVPLVFAVPAVWVGLEFFRAHLLTGFSWYYLGHTQYRWIELIQISDIVGAYGVSFLLATASACMAGLLPASLLVRLRLLPEEQATALRTGGPWRNATAVLVSVGLFAAVLTYGYIRRDQADFKTGPRIALIQGNFPTSVKRDPSAALRIFQQHHRLTGLSVRHQPDLIVWPESMYLAPLLSAAEDLTDDDLKRLAPELPPELPPEAWRSTAVSEALADMSTQAGAAMVIGIEALDVDRNGMHHYNSAALVQKSAGVTNRYDKIHRVPFGEYIPFKESLPWLRNFTPFGPYFGLDAGKGAVTFSVAQWRFAPIICFEDTVPHLVRGIVKSTSEATPDGGQIDCLVCLINDGWFHGSSELDQHLITALFRAVECRTPMIRAVNTGISAFIDGDGVVIEPDLFIDGDKQGRDSIRDPETGRFHKQLNAALVADLPLDNRSSLYVSGGDWFAGSCGLSCLILLAGCLIPRRGVRKADAVAVTSTVDAS